MSDQACCEKKKKVKEEETESRIMEIQNG